MTIHGLFATTPKGMESLLADELKELGASNVTIVRAGVSFEGKLETAYRVCLWSRLASRVLLPIGHFKAESPEELYQQVFRISWSEHLSPKHTLAVDFSSSLSKITHSQYGALKTKDAIVDQMRSKFGARPTVDPSHPDVRVNVYVLGDMATVSIDLSGDSLHKRGYRGAGVAAPLKENLAAAILMLAGWPAAAAQQLTFIDPMCGSGTLPIEAALIATHTAPGLGRKLFGFSGWRQHDAALWKRLVSEAQNSRRLERPKRPRIIGYDASPKSVSAALQNIANAGLQKHIHIERRNFTDCEPFGPNGLLVVNPPYGKRLGETENLRSLYREMGDMLKQKFRGWTANIFTANAVLAKSVGLRTSGRQILYNGSVECRLLRYELY